MTSFMLSTVWLQAKKYNKNNQVSTTLMHRLGFSLSKELMKRRRMRKQKATSRCCNVTGRLLLHGPLFSHTKSFESRSVLPAVSGISTRLTAAQNGKARAASLHTCAGSPNRVTFKGWQMSSQTLLLFLYVEMSPEILHSRLVASWLNCKHTWASNSFMTMSLKSDGRPGQAGCRVTQTPDTTKIKHTLIGNQLSCCH